MLIWHKTALKKHEMRQPYWLPHFIPLPHWRRENRMLPLTSFKQSSALHQFVYLKKHFWQGWVHIFSKSDSEKVSASPATGLTTRLWYLCMLCLYIQWKIIFFVFACVRESVCQLKTSDKSVFTLIRVSTFTSWHWWYQIAGWRLLRIKTFNVFFPADISEPTPESRHIWNCQGGTMVTISEPDPGLSEEPGDTSLDRRERRKRRFGRCPLERI